MSELKPCPFCGEEPNVFSFNDGRFIVECANPDCDVYPYTSIHYDKADAITAWNQRATVYTKPTTLSQLQEDNAKLRDGANAMRQLYEDELKHALADNAKLRELVDELYQCSRQCGCDRCGYKDGCAMFDRMAQLGVEVTS